MDTYWSNPRNVAHHLCGALGKGPNGAYPAYTGQEARVDLSFCSHLALEGANLADADIFRMGKLLDAPNLQGLSLRNNPDLTEACRASVAELALRCPKLRAENLHWPEQLAR